MLTLPADLLAQQKAASAVPFVEAKLSDFWGERTRLRFTRFYTGTEDVGDFSAAVVAADGSLVRARLHDDGTTSTLYVSRVATPGAASDYSSWTSLEAGVSDLAHCALCLDADGDTLLLFYASSTDTPIRMRSSADDGVSWSSAATVVTASAGVRSLAACAASGGDRMLVWSEGTGVVYRSRYSGSWGARTAWTNSVDFVEGLAITHFLDFQVLVGATALTTADRVIYACRLGDGFNGTANAWSALNVVVDAAVDSEIFVGHPAVLRVDGVYRAFFVELFDGTPGYERLQWTEFDDLVDFADGDNWREPAGFDYEVTGNLGVAAAGGSSGIWLVAPAGVWYSDSPALAELDVSADVVAASVTAAAAAAAAGGGRFELVLQNEAGKYTDYGSGTVAMLQRGARLQLSPGYQVGAAGAVATEKYSYWVEEIELVTGPEPRLVLRGRDATGLLDAWHARRTHLWANGDLTVTQLIGQLMARAGLEYETLGLSSLAFLEPAFTIHPGESGATALRRILEMVEDVGFFRGGTFEQIDPQADDASVYALGGADGHTIVSARYLDGGPAVNRSRVEGLGVYAEAFDFAEAEAVGERISQSIDIDLTTAANAGFRADAELRRAAIGAGAGEVRLFGVHCGVELYDVVSVTDAQAGLSLAARRVLGYAWRLETGKRPRYDMGLTLGSV